MPEQIEATFRVTTPMFLGDAEQRATSLRPPAIKGAIRFWWRALQWASCVRAANGDSTVALGLLHKREAELFGSASGSRGARQSLFLLQATLEGGSYETEPKGRTGPGHAYLLGQGLHHYSRGYERKAISAGGEISLKLTLRKEATSTHRRELRVALFLWGCLGGLGSRARRGLGSVSIETQKGSNLPLPKDPEALGATLKELLPDLPKTLPPYTAFSSQSRIDCSLIDREAWPLLGNVGLEMMMYRSWGRNGRVAGRPAERNFPGDHKSASTALAGRCPQSLPQRITFGLPHNYFFASVGQGVSIEPQHKDRKRRASSLFIHIHRFPDGSHAAVQTLLPAWFLPPDDPVEMKPQGKSPVRLQAKPAYSIIHTYLNRFPDRKGLLP